MLKIKTKKQEAYMENAMSRINLIGYKSPEVKEAEVDKVNVKNSTENNWTVEKWDRYFASRRGTNGKV